jgi:hypothetical protein
MKKLSTSAAKKEKEELDFTDEELDRMLDSSAIHQEVLKLRHSGIAPSQITASATLVLADLADAVSWQEKKNEELINLEKSDIKHERPWTRDLIEDFIAFGLNLSNTKNDAHTILTNLDKELEIVEVAGYGPDARNYIATLRKELSILIEKL